LKDRVSLQEKRIERRKTKLNQLLESVRAIAPGDEALFDAGADAEKPQDSLVHIPSLSVHHEDSTAEKAGERQTSDSYAQILRMFEQQNKLIASLQEKNMQ